ncbi:hypothetical protein [Actibacterium sp. D379-3]
MVRHTLKLFPLVLALSGLPAPVAMASDFARWNENSARDLPTALNAEFGLFNDGRKYAFHPVAGPDMREIRVAQTRFSGEGDAAQLKFLIAQAEAGAQGYDAVHLGAARRPAQNPTSMTIREILEWVKATPGQPHAIGRYQFIPSTLRDLAKRSGVDHSVRFSPQLQEHFANILLRDAGFDAFRDGRISRTRFMNNLAGIWAGLPTSSGRSAYHGYAGNRAVISWAAYTREMAAIFR